MNIKVCDLCYQIGEQRAAVAWYRDVTGKKWVICEKCLAIVEEAGLEHGELEEEAIDGTV